MQMEALKFELPSSLNADMPPERRGIRRDFVKMMVLCRQTGEMTHTSFYNLHRFLNKGDLLILNSSRTVPAVLKAEWRQKRPTHIQNIEIRLARRLTEFSWEALPIAEGLRYGDRLIFSRELSATVTNTSNPPFVTLAFSQTGTKLYDHIYTLGEPIRYEYITNLWDLDYYQTVFANVPGSVEMPSAGRAFSWELLFKLRRQGIQTAFLQLHTGLSYLLDDKWHLEPRDHYEQFTIPDETALAVAQTKKSGGRVIAVGTTVVRALESAASLNSILTAQSGWTNLQIDKSYPLQVVDGLITGFHEPEASHLDLLSAFIEPTMLRCAYEEAINQGYLWHEFGDMNVIL